MHDLEAALDTDSILIRASRSAWSYKVQMYLGLSEIVGVNIMPWFSDVGCILHTAIVQCTWCFTVTIYRPVCADTPDCLLSPPARCLFSCVSCASSFVLFLRLLIRMEPAGFNPGSKVIREFNRFEPFQVFLKLFKASLNSLLPPFFSILPDDIQ